MVNIRETSFENVPNPKYSARYHFRISFLILREIKRISEKFVNDPLLVEVHTIRWFSHDFRGSRS